MMKMVILLKKIYKQFLNILKQKAMSTLKKKATVILLTTNEASHLYTHKNALSGRHSLMFAKDITWQHEGFAKTKEGVFYNLYVISDDEIKEGDWYASWETIDEIEKNHIIQQANFKDPLDWYNSALNYKKIIATTDTSLKIQGELNVWDVNDKYLPQPSQGFINKFIEEYNNKNIISDVMVEYNEFICENGHTMSYQTTCMYPYCNKYNHPVLKTDKNNEITISSVKNSWNRNEVKQLLWKCFVRDYKLMSPDDISDKIIPLFDEWIKNNLN